MFGAAAPDLQCGFGIAGGAPGLNAAVEYDPQRVYAVIVMSNLDPPAAVNEERADELLIDLENPSSRRRFRH